MTKEKTMEIDTLRAALYILGERGGETVLPRAAAARKARRSINALAYWQIAQIGTGIGVAVAGGTVWTDLLARPGMLFASGLLLNLYGAAMIALGVAGLAHAARIDMAAPVIETEEHMARLHRIKLASGWVLGTSWWVLWLPFAAVVVRMLWNADMLGARGAGAWFAVTLAGGVAGWVGTTLFRSWAAGSGRVQLAARIDGAMTGHGFREARRRIDEVADFRVGLAE